MIIYEMLVDEIPKECINCHLYFSSNYQRAHECSKVVHEDFGVAISYHVPDERCLLRVKNDKKEDQPMSNITPETIGRCSRCEVLATSANPCMRCVSELNGALQAVHVHNAILEQTVKEHKLALDYMLKRFDCDGVIPSTDRCGNPEITCAQCKRDYIVSLFQGERRKEGERLDGTETPTRRGS